LLQDYIAAGFDPAAFWGLSPKLYTIHMRGAQARMEREAQDRRAMAWVTAMLPHMKDPPPFAEFVSGKKDRSAFRADRERKFAAMDRALEAYKKRAG